MNEATKQLFELMERCHDEEVEFDFSKLCGEVKDLIDAGADINAINQDGFNILQVLLEVESPKQSLISKINDEGYFYDEGFFVDAVLRNGFQCSKAGLTKLLSVYCGNNYHLEPGDIKLICTLLEMGADWNCRYHSEYSHEPLLFAIACNPIIMECWHNSGNANNIAYDWRYRMLSAYHKAGGDLMVQHNGKYVWERKNLPLSTLAFLLDYNVDIPAEYVKIVPNTDAVDGDVVAVDTYYYLSRGSRHLIPCEQKFFPETFYILLSNQEKYPHIFDEISGCAWANLLSEYPQFKKICDWDKLNENDWHKLLQVHPSFVRKLPCEKFPDVIPFDKLDQNLWCWLLQDHPQFADKCDLDKLAEVGDEFALLLASHPQLANKIDMNKLSGKIWCIFLCWHPQFADKCDWNKLDGEDWRGLLGKYPQFADKCDWDKLDGENWSWLLWFSPQFADKCDWDKLDGFDWYCLLQHQPQFADKCNWDKLNNELDGEEWSKLLQKQPQLEKYRK